MRVHLDTDFLVLALSSAGAKRRRLLQISKSAAQIQMSALSWYEFSRGPRTPEQLAVARSLLMEEGIVPFSDEIATAAALVFRSLGSPRKRGADIAIGVTAVLAGARLVTASARDFEGIPDLDLEVVLA